jgi:hypothetical protein
VKTFIMNIDTGLIQFVKSGGVLHIRSASDLSILETKANEISIPYNFSRIGSDKRSDGDLGIKVEYFDKPIKLLNTSAELVAKDIYRLLQCSEKLPENPPTRDNLIFKHSENYRNRLIEYLNSINHKDEFSTFKGALSIDLYSAPAPGIDETDDLGNLEEHSLQSLLSLNKDERDFKLKEAIKNLSLRVWSSISSLVKDTVSQEASRRRQLRFLVSMVQSYRTLELLCALRPRKQSQTIKSQVTKKILKESNDRLDEKDLTLYLQKGFRVERVLNSIGNKWNVLDAIENLTPCFFTSIINSCQNFEIWLEIVLSNEVISYNEAEIKYKQFKAASAYKRVMCIKQACESNGVEIQQPNEQDFNFDY